MDQDGNDAKRPAQCQRTSVAHEDLCGMAIEPKEAQPCANHRRAKPAGPSNFTVRVTDSASASATAALSITINSPALGITTASLPAGTVGVAYSQTLAASGGSPPYSWSLFSGALPPGLTLSAAGTISGTPGTAGPSNFTVRVTD